VCVCVTRICVYTAVVGIFELSWNEECKFA